MRRIVLSASLLSFLLVLLPPASAQSVFASLSGTVRDSSGAMVSGTDIVITNTASGATRRAVSNENGYFTLTYLPAPATYKLTAVSKGFQRWLAEGIALASDDSRTINIELKVGATSETVEVSGSAQEVAVVDSGEKAVGISSRELEDLSLVGRNATEFLKLLPGSTLTNNGGVNRPAYDGQVVGINGFAVGASSAGGLSAVNINGQSVDITQDGQHSFDPGAAGAATPVNPNPDMISEVRVLTSNFTSENAKGPVVVNTVTKSGGKDYHGEGYIYARNAALNAEDAFNKWTEKQNNMPAGLLKVPSSYYYPGGNIGGPLIIPGTGFNRSRQKLFFFEGFEYYRQDLDGGVDRSFVPTSDMLNGDFSALSQYGSKVNRGGMGSLPVQPTASKWLAYDPTKSVSANRLAGCTISAAGVMSSACIDPSAQLLLKDYLPAPNVDPTTTGFNYVQAFTVAQHSWQNVTRGDWNITDNTKAFVVWSRQRETANMPMGLWVNSGDWTVPAPSNVIGANGSDAVTGTLLHVFSPTMTSETRFGYTKINFPSIPTDYSKLSRQELNFPLHGIFGNPVTPAVVSWGNSIPNLGDVGHAYHPTYIAYKGIPSVAENFTKVIKSHTTKYGFYYEHTYNKQDNWGQFMGVFQYANWSASPTGNLYADMLMGIGQAGYFEQALPPPTNLAQNIAAFYAQDDWKLTRRITLQYGMRFEHYAKPYSPPFGLAVFNPATYDPTIPISQNTQTGISWNALDKNVPLSGASSRLFFFSPRVGAAIDLFGTGRTVLRGGWGKYRAYDSVQSNSYVQPAETATGSSSWSCGSNDSLCPSWADIDLHAQTPPAYGTGLAPGGPKGVFVMDPTNDEQPLVTSYSLTVDQELPARMRLELSYVGNYSDFLQGYTNFYNGIPLNAMANAVTQYPGTCSHVDSSGNLADDRGSTACQQLYRKFPAYTTINTSVTEGAAQFDSMQASLRRNVGFLTLQANYTWSKALGNGVQLANGGLPGALSKSAAEHWLWGILPQNRAQAFSIAYVFNVPKTNGSSWVRGLANGWQISGITQIQSGAQLTAQAPSTGLNFNLSQAGSNQDNVHLLGTPDITIYPVITCNPTQGLKPNQFANPNCFAPQPVGQLGTASLPYLPGPKFWNSDVTLIKNVRVTERQNLQFRFAAFNFLNHSLPSFTNGDGNLNLSFDANGKANSNFGLATYRVGHRILELGAKYSF